MSLAIVYTFTAALFLALVFSLGLQSKTIARLNGVLLFIVGISGILFYGYGYSALFPVLPPESRQPYASRSNDSRDGRSVLL